MAKGNGANTVAVVEKLVTPVIEENGCFLWDVRFEKDGPDWVLRVWLDKKDEPLDMDTVEAITRLINPILDAADPISQSYYLEVGSPGLGRRLTKPQHFATKLGQEILVHLYSPLNGSKDITGILQDYKENTIFINVNNEEISIAQNLASYVKLNDDADLF